MRLIQYAGVIWFLLAQSAVAGTLPEPQTQYLKIYWHGFQVASLVAGWERTPDGQMLSHAVIETFGLAKTVSRYKSDTMSLSDGNGVPLKFKTNFSYRKTTREIILEWRDFILTKQYNEPPEKPGKRTPISAAQKNEAYDPLTAFFAARAKVIDGVKEFTLPMFDGRRRSDLQFKVLGKRKDGTIEITMKDVFVAGYTKREQEERTKRDITMHIYVDPETYVPVGGEAQSIIGEASAKLGKTCKTFKECLVASKED